MSKRAQVFGWVLFLLSSCFFTGSSIRSGDAIALVGSVLFLVACFIFLVPLMRSDGSA